MVELCKEKVKISYFNWKKTNIYGVKEGGDYNIITVMVCTAQNFQTCSDGWSREFSQTGRGE